MRRPLSEYQKELLKQQRIKSDIRGLKNVICRETDFYAILELNNQLRMLEFSLECSETRLKSYNQDYQSAAKELRLPAAYSYML